MVSIRAFCKDEGGSVIIDWCLMTAATIGLSAYFFEPVGDHVMDLARGIETTLFEIEVPTTFADYATLGPKS